MEMYEILVLNMLLYNRETWSVKKAKENTVYIWNDVYEGAWRNDRET